MLNAWSQAFETGKIVEVQLPKIHPSTRSVRETIDFTARQIQLLQSYPFRGHMRIENQSFVVGQVQKLHLCRQREASIKLSQ
jgi:hypothetical protein